MDTTRDPQASGDPCAELRGQDAETVSGEATDFLPSLLGPAGNVYAVFAAVRHICEDVEVGLYRRFRDDLEYHSDDKTYEDVLERVEAWFGPQTAVWEYRAHMAALSQLQADAGVPVGR